MKVYLDREGLERQATGKDLYAWHYVVRKDDQAPPEHGIEIASFEPVFPSVEACIIPCLEAIQHRETELREELNVELAKLTERRNALAMLEFQA